MSAPVQHPDRDRLEGVADAILVGRAVDGDTGAFETLIRRHGPLMRAYTARIVGSMADADDVVQDAFHTAWRRLPELRDPAAVRPWLMRIASRLAFTSLRRKPAEVELPDPVSALPADTQPENVAVRNAQLKALSAALDTLPEDQRRCWLLREVGELSYDDIAQEMELPTATVRGKLARARASIYAQMEGWR
ncbi:RNA polymerase sigma-70 factor (ECF subfamily) [Cryobacterium sp. CAN_C3]|uniref:RNA polymerase sigma factor n=1 Tax=unclassified Cryobacterium TaxID=2649013 RepID=UPI0018C8FDB4|nr:RNA polymerase sigma factor [Cryobacterium sp. CAN_C3]MEC5155987.1 RNA polymerase sigma-70 factor (ECF subfamily) [Cryobacterium sp. CAN_C3]